MIRSRDFVIALSLAGTILAGPVTAAEGPVTAMSGRPTTADGTPDAGVLRRLPSIGRETKLSGETDHLVWPVWVTASEAAQTPRLRLAYNAAVSVMPEASRLDVTVNDRAVGGWRIASGGNRTLEVALPGGVLKPGWNMIRIDAEQRHRVECTIPATYELWTEIDSVRSGLVFATGYAPERRGLSDIAGIAPDDHGRVHIRLVSPQDPEPTQLRRALRLVQAMTVAGGYLDPVVEVTRTLGKGAGIDLLIGTAAQSQLERTGNLGHGVVALFDDPDPSRLVVALPDDSATLDQLADRLVEETGPSAPGTPAGLATRAALGGLPVTGDARVRLSDFGTASSEFSGRLFRTSADLRLPADLYAADYAKVTLKLAGGYAPGLDSTSRLTVRVNGRQAAGAPLSARNGEVFSDRQLQLPLSAFRPGHNRIEIEASLSHPDDRTCDTIGQIEGPKRFLLVEGTELRFPTFARVARLPDLAATAAGILGDLAEADRPSLYVPHPDPATLSAAATFLARVAAAGDRIDVPPIVFRNPPSDARSALVIGAFSDLPATVASAVGIESSAVRDAWSRRPPTTQSTASVSSGNDRVSRRLSALRVAAGDHADPIDRIVTGSVQPITTGSLATRAIGAGSGADPLDRWRRSMESPWSFGAFTRDISTRLSGLGAGLGGAKEQPRFAPRPTTGLVVAQAIGPTGGVWTLLTAPTAATLGDGIAALTESGRWNDVEGAVVAWDQVDERTATTGSVSRGFFSTRDIDLGNLRLIAAAWVSDNPIGFVLAVLLATLALGFTTARLLPHLGEKP